MADVGRPVLGRAGVTGLVVATTVAMRLRYLWTPISSDEAGYLAVARAWSRGARLYDTIWIDRQEGLLLLFRAIHSLGLGSPVGVRLLAIGAAVVAALSIGGICAALGGERARLYGAISAAVLLGIGQFEGFEANAELLSGAIGAGGLALALCWRDRNRLWPLFGAGLVSGLALMTKQSAFDTLLVALATLAWRWRREPGAGGWKRLTVYAGGVATTVGLAMLHGALTGWRRWWFAFAGYRLTYRSVFSNPDWPSLSITAGMAIPIVLPAVLVTVAGFELYRRQITVEAWVTLMGWLAAAMLSFVLGGLFFRHYWMILMFPLSALVGIAASRAPRVTVRLVALGVALAVPLWSSVRLMTVPARRLGTELGDRRWTTDTTVGHWIRQHSASHHEQVLVLCNGVGLYGNIDSDPPFPYLWQLHLNDIPGARQLLAETMTKPDRPRFAALYNDLRWCDPSGRSAAALASNYHEVVRIDFVRIFERNTG